METYKCPVCGNTDIRSIGMLNGKPYCRRCISFKGEEVEHKPSYPKKAPIHLEYELSPEQKELSDKLVENYKKGIDSLVFAVCGSGKTEISLGVIKYAINCGEKVAFAVPRKDVVIELHSRLRNIFKYNRVVAVYGGHNKDLTGDIVVLTTHQLHRYKKYFHLIILDEIDAFPFKGDPILHSMFHESLCGHYILMSATPSEEIIKEFQKENKDILRLETRFHRHPLPVPALLISDTLTNYFNILKYLKKFLSSDKQVFIFAPTIDKSKKLYFFLSLFFRHGNYVNSEKTTRKQVVDGFRNKAFRYLVTTSVLERGVTVKDLQVIVFDADNVVYDKGTLIQIAGRVGRKIDAPKGEVIFIGKRKTKAMEECIRDINRSNQALQDLLSRDQD